MNKIDIITPIYRYRTIVSRTISFQQLNPAAHFQAHFFFLNILVGVVEGIQTYHFEAAGTIETYSGVVAGLSFEHQSAVTIYPGDFLGLFHQKVTNAPTSKAFFDQQFINAQLIAPILLADL